MNSAAVIRVSPNIEPTDRSISRIEIRNSMPAAMIPTFAAFWTTSLSWPHARKSGCAIPITPISATVAIRTLLDSTSRTRLPQARPSAAASLATALRLEVSNL